MPLPEADEGGDEYEEGVETDGKLSLSFGGWLCWDGSEYYFL